MKDKTTNQLENRLSDALAESRIKEKQLAALMNGARAILEEKNFYQAARAIFDYCRETSGATSGYVALLTEDGSENEVLFLESGGLPCSVDPELPMPIRGLRGEAYRDSRVVYHNDFMSSEWTGFLPEGHVKLRNVLFAPLTVEGVTIGLIGLANKDGDFSEEDARIVGSFGELAAIALQNSKALREREIAEQEREKMILELKKALQEVKTLSGLFPICASCKKIRDDRGYWNQLEQYISEHSDADFSHSICPDCMKKLYPDIDLDE
ncbi:MAG: GAF domain-containing protein [Desulfobia sp.]